jgi:hypothetical protein
VNIRDAMGAEAARVRQCDQLRFIEQLEIADVGAPDHRSQQRANLQDLQSRAQQRRKVVTAGERVAAPSLEPAKALVVIAQLRVGETRQVRVQRSIQGSIELAR